MCSKRLLYIICRRCKERHFTSFYTFCWRQDAGSEKETQTDVIQWVDFVHLKSSNMRSNVQHTLRKKTLLVIRPRFATDEMGFVAIPKYSAIFIPNSYLNVGCVCCRSCCFDAVNRYGHSHESAIKYKWATANGFTRGIKNRNNIWVVRYSLAKIIFP